jgi:hypothetical protein
MTRRVAPLVAGLGAAVLIAGCGQRTSTDQPQTTQPRNVAATSSRPVTLTLAPSAVPTTPAGTDPALWAAVKFERAHCTWDWRQPMATYIRSQQSLATPAYAKQIAAAADPVAWRGQVVATKQTVTCSVTGRTRVVNAPNTARAVYVRVTVEEHVTSTMGTFDGGVQIASWLLRRIGDQWLVAGTFEGG